MKELKIDLAIIGGGPAGMAAALSAYDLGVKATIIERDDDLGGILQQCIHPGFGLHVFNEELTGPEFGERYKQLVIEKGIDLMLNTIITGITPDKTIIAFNPEEGLLHIKAKAIVLSMGARERTRGAIKIPGTRPAGVYTAGLAQRLINIEGQMPGKEVVILGSGDIGMIMARRLSLEGAKVHKVVEILPYTSGLLRNKVQCLDDFGIPLLLRHTVTHIHGKERLDGVTIAEVDEKWIAIPGTEQFIPCDTLLLSVGITPEIDFALDTGIKLSKGRGPIVNEYLETSISGIFACGNVLHIHDLVDNVVKEGSKAGISAALYLKGQLDKKNIVPVKAGNGILYVVPHKTSIESLVKTEQSFQFRVKKPGKKVTIGIFSLTGEDNKILLYKKRFKFTMPSEMITMVLKPIEEPQIGREIIIDIIEETDK
ncbi:MAG: NAD(P)/FAD-dependent oxidoreductase [Candidatus Hodarchaeales archaeon]